MNLSKSELVRELSYLVKITGNKIIAYTNKLRINVKSKCFEAEREYDDNKQHDYAEFIRSLREHMFNNSEKEGQNDI